MGGYRFDTPNTYDLLFEGNNLTPYTFRAESPRIRGVRICLCITQIINCTLINSVQLNLVSKRLALYLQSACSLELIQTWSWLWMSFPSNRWILADYSQYEHSQNSSRKYIWQCHSLKSSLCSSSHCVVQVTALFKSINWFNCVVQFTFTLKHFLSMIILFSVVV